MKHALNLSVALILGWPALVHGGGGTVMGNGGATEITQLLNNAELAASTAKQASMVSEQVKSNFTQYQQYSTMVTNLKSLPQEILEQANIPYLDQIMAMREVYNAVKDVKEAAEDTRDLFNRRIGEMKSLNMKPSEYLKAEIALATRKGGIYERQLRADLKAIDNLRQRSEQLQRLSKTKIAGNVEGLQLLNQQTSMLTGEMMDLKASILQQNAIATQDRIDGEREKSVANDAARRNSEEEDRRDQRNKAFSENVQFKPSWVK